MDVADEIVVSEGLAPSTERDLLVKIAKAVAAARADGYRAARAGEPEATPPTALWPTP